MDSAQAFIFIQSSNFFIIFQPVHAQEVEHFHPSSVPRTICWPSHALTQNTWQAVQGWLVGQILLICATVSN